MKIRFVLYFVCFLTCCKAPKFTDQLTNSEAELLMKKYRSDWFYIEQKDSAGVNLTVLYFSAEAHSSVISHPAFVIGVTAKGDTIGAVDQNLPQGSFIQKGEIIKLGFPEVSLWKDWPINHTPAFRLEKDPNILKLHERLLFIFNCSFESSQLE